MRRRIPNLARSARAKRKPKLAVLVYCEGEKTEPNYLREFAKVHGNQLVVLRIADERGGPRTLVEAAAQERRRQRKHSKDSFEARDETWVVFDRDEHPNIPEAMDLARRSGIEVAFSNPCFELWLLIHLVDHDPPDDRHQVQKKLAGLVKGYDPKTSKICDFGSVAPGYGAACIRARAMRRRRDDEGAPLGNPYTGIDVLTELIRENGKL